MVPNYSCQYTFNNMENAVKGLLIAADATKRQEFIRSLDAPTIASLLASRDEEVTKIIADNLDVEKWKQVAEAVVAEAATRVSVTNNAVTTTTIRRCNQVSKSIAFIVIIYKI